VAGTTCPAEVTESRRGATSVTPSARGGRSSPPRRHRVARVIVSLPRFVQVGVSALTGADGDTRKAVAGGTCGRRRRRDERDRGEHRREERKAGPGAVPWQPP